MCYQSARQGLRSEIGGRLRVYKGSTGSVLWESDEAHHTTRPVVVGHTINAIPGGGLVRVPDATDGCACSYLNRSWIALRPVEK